jgi:DNA-binding XRE family transcriptional regulator
MTDLATLKARILANPEARAEYEAQAPEFDLPELIAARDRAGLTQAELAERMHTTQSTIARLESGRTLPSMRTLPDLPRQPEAAVVRLERAA